MFDRTRAETRCALIGTTVGPSSAIPGNSARYSELKKHLERALQGTLSRCISNRAMSKVWRELASNRASTCLLIITTPLL